MQHLTNRIQPIYAERIMRKVDEDNIEEDSEGELAIGGRRLTNLRYADDTTLLASTQQKAKKIFKDLIVESAQYNMQINAKKTKGKGCYSERRHYKELFILTPKFTKYFFGESHCRKNCRTHCCHARGCDFRAECIKNCLVGCSAPPGLAGRGAHSAPRQGRSQGGVLGGAPRTSFGRTGTKVRA